MDDILSDILLDAFHAGWDNRDDGRNNPDFDEIKGGLIAQIKAAVKDTSE